MGISLLNRKSQEMLAKSQLYGSKKRELKDIDNSVLFKLEDTKLIT